MRPSENTWLTALSRAPAPSASMRTLAGTSAITARCFTSLGRVVASYSLCPLACLGQVHCTRSARVPEKEVYVLGDFFVRGTESETGE